MNWMKLRWDSVLNYKPWFDWNSYQNWRAPSSSVKNKNKYDLLLLNWKLKRLNIMNKD